MGFDALGMGIIASKTIEIGMELRISLNPWNYGNFGGGFGGGFPLFFAKNLPESPAINCTCKNNIPKIR